MSGHRGVLSIDLSINLQKLSESIEHGSFDSRYKNLFTSYSYFGSMVKHDKRRSDRIMLIQSETGAQINIHMVL